jgi:iron complex transport system ATP-binding protein
MALAFDNLSLSLRDRQVLCDISGSLAEGEITVILGANGAGKSTLISCLAGLRAPDRGSVTLSGKALDSYSATDRAQRIGLLPQNADIHWNLGVRHLVALGRLPHRGRWKLGPEDEAAIDAAMVATDCLHLAERKAQRLSGGEQARVLLARVLAGQPNWILADEPFASLDPAHQIDAAQHLRDAADAGTGLAVVMHDLTHAARLADKVIMMKDGAIIASGVAGNVMTPDILKAAYGVEVHVGTDNAGAPLIVPIGRSAA